MIPAINSSASIASSPAPSKGTIMNTPIFPAARVVHSPGKPPLSQPQRWAASEAERQLAEIRDREARNADLSQDDWMMMHESRGFLD